MKRFFTLWKREVASYFVSPVAYILATLFLVVMGMGFWFLASVRLRTGATFYELLRGLYGGVAWLAVLMVVPVLSMRSFAEENRSGTLEMLLTAPVRDIEVVFSKFLGIFTVYVVMWLPTLAFYPLLQRVSEQPLPIDFGALAAAYVGVFLVGGFYLSIGIFCSSLTRNLIVASMSTFAVVTLLFLGGFLPAVSPVPQLREFTQPLSPVLHMMDYARGVIDTRSVVLYLSSTLLMLMITTRGLESRRWRA
ncbi:ABC transporter permease [Kiritimatiellaeota bacterium B1221]|nr:ABC transporter permease [Kiritimatiellaeota bacterium B1221]